MWLLSQALYSDVYIFYYIHYSDYEKEEKNSQVGACGWTLSGKYKPAGNLTAGLVYQFPS